MKRKEEAALLGMALMEINQKGRKVMHLGCTVSTHQKTGNSVVVNRVGHVYYTHRRLKKIRRLCKFLNVMSGNIRVATIK